MAGRQHIECVAQGFANTFEPVEHVDGGQDMRGIGALAAFGLDQPLVFEQQEQVLEVPLFGATGQEAGTKLALYRGIKTGVGQLEGQGILPIDASSHGIGGLAVGQSLSKLHHGNERQLRRGLSWRAVLRKEVGEVGIGEEWAKRVTHAHIGIAFGEGGTRDPRRLVGNDVGQGCIQRHQPPPYAVNWLDAHDAGEVEHTADRAELHERAQLH